MVKAAKIFALHAQKSESDFGWHDCVDHLLNLVNKLAFTVFPG